MLTGAPRPGATHPIVGMADQLGIEPILETGRKEQAFGAAQALGVAAGRRGSIREAFRMLVRLQPDSAQGPPPVLSPRFERRPVSTHEPVSSYEIDHADDQNHATSRLHEINGAPRTVRIPQRPDVVSPTSDQRAVLRLRLPGMR